MIEAVQSRNNVIWRSGILKFHQTSLCFITISLMLFSFQSIIEQFKSPLKTKDPLFSKAKFFLVHIA